MKSNNKIYQSSAGFTLIELLVAMSITIIVVTLAGSGLIAIMQNNIKAESETLRRVELNRALDFISDEIRTSKNITTNASTNLSTVAPGFNPTGKTPVLTLEIPGVSQRVIYYTESPATTDVWLGPKVIYRWGPYFNNNGQYANASNNPVAVNNNPANWQGNALVDLIADSTPASNTTCPTAGWVGNPSASNGQGFTTCVDPTGKIAELYLRGHLTGAYNNPLAPYVMKTRVFARGS